MAAAMLLLDKVSISAADDVWKALNTVKDDSSFYDSWLYNLRHGQQVCETKSATYRRKPSQKWIVPNDNTRNPDPNTPAPNPQPLFSKWTFSKCPYTRKTYAVDLGKFWSFLFELKAFFQISSRKLWLVKKIIGLWEMWLCNFGLYDTTNSVSEEVPDSHRMNSLMEGKPNMTYITSR